MSAPCLERRHRWRQYRTFIDVGCTRGCVPVDVALAHPHVARGSFDLPIMGPIFEQRVTSFRIERRLIPSGDFFQDPLPESEVLARGRVLHDWDLAEKKMLLARAYAASPKGGALIIYKPLINDARRQYAPV